MLLPAGNVECCIAVSVLALALILLSVFRLRKVRNRRRRRNIMRRIDTMSGVDFELFLARYFREQGYRVEITRASGDFGADLILSKGGKRIAVQAKRWARSVGVSSVQEVIAARHYYRAHEALLVTNSRLTRNALMLARGTDVTVWSRQCLIEKLERA